MDCNSNRLTGRPAKTKLSLTLRNLLMPRFLKLEKLRHHIIVNNRVKGTIRIIDGNSVGFVPIKIPNRIRPAMLEIIMERFIVIYCTGIFMN